MKKKILALGVCASMLAVAIVGGTMAYFTDTDEAENVFTVGNIDIDLREFKGDGTTPFEDIKNIMPGMPYDKIVNVKNEGSNDAYVQVTVVIPKDMTPVWNDAVGVKGSGKEWEEATITEAEKLNTSGKFVFRRSTKLGMDDKTTDNVYENITSAILKAVTLNADVTEITAADSYKVTVTADAIQADSFNSAADAYAALESAVNEKRYEEVSNVDEMNTALANTTNKVVQMANNVTSGNDIKMAAGTILDGNGYTLNKTSDADPSVNAGIDTVGGTVKNITITGVKIGDAGFRAIYATSGIDADLVIDNATLSGTYALNITGASPEQNLVVKNSTLNGWTSYAPLASAKFDNVTFGTDTASGFHNLKPQADTVLNNCTFDEAFVMDAGAKVTITLNECKVNGTTVTAANFATLFTVEPEITQFGCTVVVDGVTVAFN